MVGLSLHLQCMDIFMQIGDSSEGFTGSGHLKIIQRGNRMFLVKCFYRLVRRDLTVFCIYLFDFPKLRKSMYVHLVGQGERR